MPDGAVLTAAPTATDSEGHYLQAVAEVGDTQKLVVTQSIYAANGIKLLEAGTALTSRTLERLVGHRLAAPIENCVAAEETVRAADLVARARELTETQPALAQFIAPADRSTQVWARLGAAPLPPSVLFRLTVTRRKYEALYDHSVRAAVVALATGMGGRLGDRELELLATAALMHDFGMLHTDPAAFETDRPLDSVARRQLRAHPVTGMLIAQREPQLNPAIGIAILQHHERLDGSGYPSAPAPEQISRMARILMLVEIVLAMLEHRPHLPELQVSLILRMNHRSFDRDFANVLLATLPRVTVDESAAAAGENGAAAQLARQLSAWRAITTDGAPAPLVDARNFVEERLVRLRRFLTEAGIDATSDCGSSAWLGDDPAARAELNGLKAEALWQVRQSAFDALLRWPQLAADDAGASGSPSQALSKWLLDATKPLATSPD